MKKITLMSRWDIAMALLCNEGHYIALPDEGYTVTDVEMSACTVVEVDNESFVERVDDNTSPDFWSVYVRGEDGRAFCLADFETPDAAMDAMRAVNRALGL